MVENQVTIAVIGTKLDLLNERVEQILEDHEARIRTLERKSVWSQVFDGVLAVGSAIGAFIGTRT